MSLKGRLSPAMSISTKLVLDGTTETAVTDANAVALSGIYLWGACIQSFDDITALTTLKILDAGTTKLEFLVNTTATLPHAGVITFPRPIAINGALTVQHGQDSDIDWYFLYTEF